MTILKSHEKKCQNCFRVTYDHCDMVKCRQNMDFEEMNTEPSTGKNHGY